MCDEPVEETGGTHVGTDANCAGGVWAEVYADVPGRICEHKVVDVSVRNLEVASCTCPTASNSTLTNVAILKGPCVHLDGVVFFVK